MTRSWREGEGEDSRVRNGVSEEEPVERRGEGEGRSGGKCLREMGRRLGVYLSYSIQQ